MQERRIVFSFGIVYNTSPAKLKNIPLMIKNIIDDLDLVRYDRAHFLSFGDSSLNFEVVYYVNSPEYNLYMDKQQAINLEIIETFEREQIEFAFPTQTIFVSKVYQEEVQSS
jgi:small-conductance mechanosensitive channel